MEDKKKEFEKIFRDNYSRLFYCALDFVDDADEAKDIVSDACMEAWRHFDQLRSSNPSSYLYMSVRNRAINALRHHAVERQYREEIIKAREEAQSSEPSLHEERMAQVEKIVLTLPEQTQRVFNLCCISDYSYKETATKLGVSVSAVHKHVSRALARLRGELSEKRLNIVGEGNHSADENVFI